MPKQIITVGYQIPAHSDLYHGIDSRQSLLDADIVVFSPDIPYSYRYDATTYLGKSCLDERGSFQLKDSFARWNSELAAILNEGKTVFLILRGYEEISVHTGQSTYSGTGRNARRTNIVESYDSFRCLPVRLPKVITQKGSSIHFRPHPVLATLWNEFGEKFAYECYFDGQLSETVFTTRVGGKAVGGLVPVGKGTLVILPNLEYDEGDLISKKDGKSVWNAKGMRFGNRLVQLLVEIDAALREASDETPAPAWADTTEFALASELKVRDEISRVASKIEELNTRSAALHADLARESLLKALLYEKGKRLEAAVIEGLKILGYQAENFDDGSLELDQVIVSPEGDRFIGETEGKDASAINIEKFRQLASNIQEDLERPEIDTTAKGVLFGNPHRLTLPSERAENFTAKCLSSASRSGTALITTAELFRVARYVKETGDDNFAASVRKAIAETVGEVTLPEIPALRE